MAETLHVEEETTPAPAASSAGPRVRTAIAVLITHFPRIDETFILREINELERHGQPVLVVPLVRVFPQVVHEEAKPWAARAIFTPFLSFAILGSNLRAMVSKPLQYLLVLSTVVLRSLWRPSLLVRSVAIFPKAIHLADVLTKLGVKHVHAHFATHATTAAWVISSISDISYSFTVHGPDVFVHRSLLREKLAGARFVRCISTFNKAFLAGLYPHETRGNLDVVRTGVNPEVYLEASRSARPHAKPAVQLLAVAALTPSRGFPLLIDACARLINAGYDLECKIVGDGRLRVKTEEWIARHGLSDRVRLLGARPQHEVARLMGEADIFVFPSIIAVDGQMDGIPMSLMEAMAAGKPVVASAIAGIPELVRDEVNGLLVDGAYPQRIEAAIRRLVEEPDLRQRLGEAGRQTVRQRFDIRQNSQSLIELLDSVEQSNQPTPSTEERIRLLSWNHIHATSIGVRRIHERPDSYIAEVTLSDGGISREVIVRQYCGPSPEEAQARARHEFEVLTALQHSSPESASWSVPSLLMFDEPHAALVVERADGKSLAGILNAERGRIAPALRKTGQWLRGLQEKTESAEDRRHVVTGVVLLALNDLELAAAADPVLFRHQSRISARLRSLEEPVASSPLRVAGHHGNFIPENIFIGSRDVTVVDFGGYRDGLPLEDVAELLMHLELGGVDEARRAFLEGYGRELDHDALQLVTIARALHFVARRGASDSERRKLRKMILRCLG